PRLVTSRAEPGPGAGRRGRELFDLPGAPRPDPGTEAPVRLLPELDGLLLSHAGRTRLVAEADRRRLPRPNGLAPGTVLVDGTVAGCWTLARADRTATLSLTAFRPLPRTERAAVEDEALRLAQVVADDVADHAVVWAADDARVPGTVAP